jgi:hypothetical protein
LLDEHAAPTIIRSAATAATVARVGRREGAMAIGVELVHTPRDCHVGPVGGRRVVELPPQECRTAGPLLHPA